MLAVDAISWFSWAQKLTGSATSESGYIVLAEATNELRFLGQENNLCHRPLIPGSLFMRTTRAQ